MPPARPPKRPPVWRRPAQGRPEAIADPRTLTGLRAQLDTWRSALAGGADRIGWKMGLDIPEAAEPVIGHLTSATRLESGTVYRAGAAQALNAECEAALEIGEEERIVGIGAALELVDVARPGGGLEAIVAGNVFHRAFVLGPSHPVPPTGQLRAACWIGGERRACVEAAADFADTVRTGSGLLQAAGEGLQPGDRIIAGSLTHVPVEPGDDVVVEIQGLGRLAVSIAA